MSFCPNCGAPCSVCTGEADEFGLLAFSDPITRNMLTRVMKKMKLHNPTHQGQLVAGLAPYKERNNTIQATCRDFLGRHNAPNSIPYFVAMVKGKAVRRDKSLAKLPPRAESRYEDE